MKNVELKSRAPHLAEARRVCVRIGALFSGVLVQRDTYFAVPRGRLKLREVKDGPAELIAYIRPSAPRARLCDYVVVPVPEPAPARRMLARTLGVLAEVRKRRELYLYDGVRIHLDRVARLGTFVEFEAVLASGRCAAWGRRMLAQLRREMGFAAADLVPVSYLDLILESTL